MPKGEKTEISRASRLDLHCNFESLTPKKSHNWINQLESKNLIKMCQLCPKNILFFSEQYSTVPGKKIKISRASRLDLHCNFEFSLPKKSHNWINQIESKN